MLSSPRSRPPRVLLLTSIFPPQAGGASSVGQAQWNALADPGRCERLIVLTARCAGRPRTERQGLRWILRWLPAREGGSLLRRGFAALATFGGLAVWLPWLVRIHRIDIVHVHLSRYSRFPFAPLLIVLRRLGGVRIVGDASDRFISVRWLSWLCHAVVCNCEGVRDHVRRGFAGPLHLLRLPLDLPARAPEGATLARYGLRPKRYLLFVGWLTAFKGVRELVGAMSRLEGLPGVEALAIVGPLVDRSLREVMAREARVRYLGELPRAEVWDLMAGARLLALPSRSEGLPMVCLEALAVGTPALAPPGVPEFAAWGWPWVFEDLSAEGVASAIRETLIGNKPPPSYPLSEHRPERYGAGLEAVYREVAAQDRPER